MQKQKGSRSFQHQLGQLRVLAGRPRSVRETQVDIYGWGQMGQSEKRTTAGLNFRYEAISHSAGSTRRHKCASFNRSSVLTRKPLCFHSNKVKLGLYDGIHCFYFHITLTFVPFHHQIRAAKPGRRKIKKDAWTLAEVQRTDRQSSDKGATPSQQSFLSTNKIIKRLRVCFPLFFSFFFFFKCLFELGASECSRGDGRRDRVNSNSLVLDATLHPQFKAPALKANIFR